MLALLVDEDIGGAEPTMSNANDSVEVVQALKNTLHDVGHLSVPQCSEALEHCFSVISKILDPLAL